MDIYGRILEDHKMQRQLSQDLLNTSGDSAERRHLFDALAKEVEAHAAAEEQVFYAELIAKPEGQEAARHSIAEHKDAADLLDELSNLDMASGGWLNKFKKLKHELDHHMDEEEQDVFTLARPLIDRQRATDLATEFGHAKDEHLST